MVCWMDPALSGLFKIETTNMIKISQKNEPKLLKTRPGDLVMPDPIG